MNQHVTLTPSQLAPASYEQQARANAKAVRDRLYGKPKVVNVIRDVLGKAQVAKPKWRGTHCQITVPMPVETAYNPISDVCFGPRTMKEIAAEVLAAFPAVTMEDIRGHSRIRRIVRPRQLIVYAIKTEQPFRSWPEIGKFIGGRDHTTALHAYRRVAAEKARAA